MRKKITFILGLTLLLIIFTGTSIMAAGSEYIVKPGDSLWSIAHNNGTTVENLKQLNGLTSDLLNIGAKLKLSSSSQVAVKPSNQTVASNSGAYVVQPGDSLWQISLKYGTTVAKLKEINGLTSDMLTVGQKLNVGGGAVVNTAAVTPSRSGDNVDGSRVISVASKYLGTKYVYGGQSPSGFDCSGFVYYVYQQLGYSLPRTAASQFGKGVAIDKGNLQAGDLVFFTCGGGSYINHVGIYAGNGRFIHSSSPKNGGVIYSSLNASYYAGYYAGAKRILR